MLVLNAVKCTNMANSRFDSRRSGETFQMSPILRQMEALDTKLIIFLFPLPPTTITINVLM